MNLLGPFPQSEPSHGEESRPLVTSHSILPGTSSVSTQKVLRLEEPPPFLPSQTRTPDHVNLVPDLPQLKSCAQFKAPWFFPVVELRSRPSTLSSPRAPLSDAAHPREDAGRLRAEPPSAFYGPLFSHCMKALGQMTQQQEDTKEGFGLSPA